MPGDVKWGRFSFLSTVTLTLLVLFNLITYLQLVIFKLKALMFSIHLLLAYPSYLSCQEYINIFNHLDADHISLGYSYALVL